MNKAAFIGATEARELAEKVLDKKYSGLVGEYLAELN